VEGLEPPASGFGDRRSSQLSYTPIVPAGGGSGGRRKSAEAMLSSAGAANWSG
jgi:hypothetical protein